MLIAVNVTTLLKKTVESGQLVDPRVYFGPGEVLLSIHVPLQCLGECDELVPRKPRGLRTTGRVAFCDNNV